MVPIFGVVVLASLYIYTYIDSQKGADYDSDYNDLINDYLICRYAEANEKTK
jgi:hypothetical protein